MNQRDQMFSNQLGQVSDFRFDERVVRVFPDMINRSIPGYALIIPMIGLLAREYVQPGTQVYDLGCSLGAATLAIRRALQVDDARILAIDNSEAMVKRCCEVVAEDNSRVPVHISLGDVRDTNIENASLVVLNFTLQFLAPDDRQLLLSRIHAGLNPGGAVILSEKIHFSDEREQATQTHWHHQFKRSQGYSDLEIAQKRNALEKVMITDTLDAHQQRLTEAGFKQIYNWFQCFSFTSLLAVKETGTEA